MTVLKALQIQHLRNLETLRLEPGPGVNVFYGENGSGKTSLLEGVYLLGLARSFRTSTTRPIIQHEKTECVVSGKLSNGLHLGVRKTGRGRQEVRIGGKTMASAAELARELPLQMLNSDTFAILEGPPKARRSYLDWGVFHVEPLFLGNWRHTLKSLKQRNTLLKRQASASELAPWNIELARYGEKIDLERQSYLNSLKPVAEELLARLLPEGICRLDLAYQRGWPEDSGLLEMLASNDERDRRVGHTTQGPHRADLVMTLDGRPASECLSRGQQKLVICALKLAQTAHLRREQGKACLFLLDDIASELDAENRRRVCQLLEDQEQQVFLTCIDRDQANYLWKNQAGVRLFHVKHGKISPVSEA